VPDHEQTAKILADGRVDHCNFTGSVAGGRAIERAAAGTFTSLGLELGGKDPAYVRADADLDDAIGKSSTAPSSIPGSAAAASSASMCTKPSTTASSTASST
jgi:acyl-CoA reductase-like NAD-dependent aldehyde dehydrogenase